MYDDTRTQKRYQDIGEAAETLNMLAGYEGISSIPPSLPSTFC
jgi:hypothetical protein